MDLDPVNQATLQLLGSVACRQRKKSLLKNISLNLYPIRKGKPLIYRHHTAKASGYAVYDMTCQGSIGSLALRRRTAIKVRSISFSYA